MTWWQRLRYWLTHAGQWSAPEWNLTPDPNEGPPWPDKKELNMYMCDVRPIVDNPDRVSCTTCDTSWDKAIGVTGCAEGKVAAPAEAPRLLRVPTSFHSVDDVLETAKKLDLSNVLVLSEREDGSIVFLDNEMTMAQANWVLDRVKALLVGPEQKMRP